MSVNFGLMACIVVVVLVIGLSNSSSARDPEGSSIYCEYYNGKKCGGEFGDDCLEKLDCGPAKPDKRRLCFASWSYDDATGRPVVVSKGCLVGPLEECYDKPNCTDERQLGERKARFFCCCDGSMCNVNISANGRTQSPISPRPSPDRVTSTDQEGDPVEERQSFAHHLLAKSLSISLLFVASALAAAFGLWRRKRSKTFDEISIIEGGLASRPLPIHFAEIKARGRYGTVWKAKLRSEAVAVKIFLPRDRNSWANEREIFELARIGHENVLRFVGAVESSDDGLWLVTAYHERGSLGDYLKANVVSWPELCRIAETMARGLGHLHREIGPNDDGKTGTDDYKPAVAHRDFKSRNVLLKNDMSACIADFGLALILRPNKLTGDNPQQVGTCRYMAPELLEGAIDLTSASLLRIDMYACGLVIWELVSRCSAQKGPVGDYRLPFEKEVGRDASIKKIRECVVVKKQRPLISDAWREHPGLRAVCETIEECWDEEPEARLSALCVMERMANSRQITV